MPTDNCVQFDTSADIKTNCVSTDDGSGSQKCCLATFDSPPKTPSQANNLASFDIAIVKPTKGGKVDTDTRYYACYKDAGKIRFKTGLLTTTVDGVGVEAWVSSALFCAADKLGTDVSS